MKENEMEDYEPDIKMQSYVVTCQIESWSFLA